MDLYKVVSQLTDDEFDEIYGTFTANKADKSAAFLRIIRDNPESPDKDFLEAFDISPSAFYVLKSRLNQKIEAYLLNRVGDPNLHVVQRVLNVNDLVFDNPRALSVAALRKLEKELLKFDFPYGLMIVYRELQHLHAFDDNYQFFRSRYNQQVAYALAMDKAADLVVNFFRSYDLWYLGRKDRDLNDMVRTMEKIDNTNNLYESHRLYIYKSIIHLFARLFIEIPDTIRCEVESAEEMFEKSFSILEEYKEDTFYSRLNLLFNYLRYFHYQQTGDQDKARIYFDILDFKIEELLTGYHLNANTSTFLSHKLRHHFQTDTRPKLLEDVENYLSELEVEPYRLSLFVDYHTFLAHTQFANGHFQRASRILYNLRTEVNLRKYTHADLETKFFLALCYVMIRDFDLANQIILSLQRQLRKPTLARYAHGKVLLKILTVALSGKPRTRKRNLKTNIGKWQTQNKGRYALLEVIDFEDLLLKEEEPTAQG